VQRRDLHPHLEPQLRVEVRERLVEEEDHRLPHDGPPDGHPLPLPARKLPRAAVEKLVDLEELRRRVHAPLISSLGIRMFSSPKDRFCRTDMCG
jgi:hypothetical protein